MPFEMRTDTSLPTITILVEGTDVTEQLEIVSLECSHVLDRIAYAHVILRDGDPAAQTFAVSEGPLCVPGAKFELLMGYHRNDEKVFEGVITRQKLDAPLHGSTRLHIEAKHTAFRMAHARKSRNWVEVSDADAIGEIADSYGISFDGTSDQIRPVLVQHQATDWDFAVMRTQMLGLGLLCSGDALTFVKPEPASAEATLTYGRDIFAVEMELNAEQQAAEIETGAWDAAEQAVATAQSPGPPFVGPGNTKYAALGDIGGDDPHLRLSGARDQAELDEWAYAEGVRRRISAMRGTIEVQGNAVFLPGMTVQLAGLGDRFNGPAIVTGVRQQYARGDWRSFLQIGLDPASHRETVDVEAPAAGGMLPGIRGLLIGTVDALEGDPSGEERVAVRISTETDTEEPIWARPVSIGGGADRGFVMLPEIGDEVLLGFLDGDPRDPVLLGGVHSSANPSPYPGADDNHVKGITSRTGMKIMFDDEAVVTTLETPGGHKVTLDDDGGEIALADSNGNTLTLSADGITLESGKDIILKAQGDVSLEGLNISATAQAEASIEGSAGAKLQSSGQTTVKGSIVNIN